MYSSSVGFLSSKTLSLRAQKAAELHSTIPGLPQEAIEEVSAYFKESWGNRTRIDYGSGMELNFLCWMYVLCH